MFDARSHGAGIMYTLSGQRIDLRCPTPDMIVWDDVFHALSHENRYNGHTTTPYSTGQHTLAMCEYLLDAPLIDQQIAFLHDLPEYVLGDVTSPLKRLLGEYYQMLETAWENAFCEKVGMESWHYSKRYMIAVKDIDALAWQAEATLLQPNRPDTIYECTDERMLVVTQAWSVMKPDDVFQTLHIKLKELFQ